MTHTQKTARAAVVQAAPILFERAATVEKGCGLVRKAAGQGAQIVLLPEAFVPTYPRGLTFGMAVGSRSPEGGPCGRDTGRMRWTCPVP